MTVRCVQCGQENNPQYRFCGMCGAPLGPPPAPVPVEVGRERVRVPVSGPSFLGLGDERYRDLDYLLEDELPRGHGRLYLALLLLVVSGALLAWHWQRDGYPWAGFILKPTVSRTAPVNSAPVPAPDSASAAAPVVPVEPTANPAPPEAQPATGEAVQPPAAEPGGGNTPANPSVAAKPADQTPPPNDVPDSGEAAAKAPPTASSQASEPQAAEPAPEEMRVAPAAPTPKSVSPKPSPAIPSPTFEDRLVADGEKYLYGRGVPEDCERAQRNLQIGARQSNARAQTLLGAMYATGHCVNRDLPTAYRWFAKALHGDPGNSRVQRDLEVLWKQMTPEERQLAMKSQ
jgi:hypothetical protein